MGWLALFKIFHFFQKTNFLTSIHNLTIICMKIIGLSFQSVFVSTLFQHPSCRPLFCLPPHLPQPEHKNKHGKSKIIFSYLSELKHLFKNILFLNEMGFNLKNHIIKTIVLSKHPSSKFIHVSLLSTPCQVPCLALSLHSTKHSIDFITRSFIEFQRRTIRS